MKTRESLGRDVLRLVIWYPFRWALLVLPFRAGIALLRGLGDINFRVGRRKRHVLRTNLQRIGAPPEHADHIVKGYLRNHYVDQLFPLIAGKFDQAAIRRHVDFEGLQHLDAALEGGRGAVLVHGHFGPAHAPLVALARLGYDVNQIGNPSDKGLSWIGRHVAFRLRMHYESKLPAGIIGTETYLRPVFRALQGNGVIMITGDGSGTDAQFGRQTSLPFFGHAMDFPLGPAILSRKTGAPLLPMFILPGTHKLFRIVIEAPLVAETAPGTEIEALTRSFVDRLEHYVSEAPEYMHFLDRIGPGAPVAEG